VGTPSTLFTFNLDGLANIFCGERHEVLEPHGAIDRALFQDEARYREFLDGTAAYDVRIPQLTAKVLPAPEDWDVLLGQPYRRARRLLPLARAVIIIGYSFGDRSGILDDAVSFEFFVSRLRLQPRPVFILSAAPHDLDDK